MTRSSNLRAINLFPAVLTFTDLNTILVGHGKTFCFFNYYFASHATGVICFVAEQFDQAKAHSLFFFLFKIVFEGLLFSKCAELMTWPDVGNGPTLTQRRTPQCSPP